MNKTILVFMLLLLLPFGLAVSDGDVVEFSNHYGQYKGDILTIESYLTGNGCFYNYDGGSVYTNSDCENNDLGIRVKISPFLPNEIINNYDSDGIFFVNSTRTNNCVNNDYSASCFYPYNYYVWVAGNDIFNLDDISRYTDVEFVTENNYNYFVWAGNYPYATSSLYNNILFGDTIKSVSDIEELEAIRHGFTKNSFGNIVCKDNVLYCLSHKSTCYANTNDEVLSSQSCSSYPTAKSDYYKFDRLIYDTSLNYWSYPVGIKSVIIYTTTNDGSEYYNGKIDPKGINHAPQHRYNYESGEISVLSDSFYPSDSPYEIRPSGLDNTFAVPLDTSKYDTSDIASVRVEIDFYMSENYRHKSPLDRTAHFNDLFSNSVSSDFYKDTEVVRYSVVLTDIESSTTTGNETNDVIHDLNASINVSTEAIDGEDTNYNDFDSGFESDEFSDEIEGMTRIAKTMYGVTQEKTFFSNMYGVALLFFGVFLMVFTLLGALLFFAVIGILFFGLWSSMFKAIDEIFRYW